MDGLDQSESKSSESTNEENLFLKLSDKSLLDCTICFQPLTIPVFQCSNGHVTCSSCHARLKPKCPTCSTILGDSRNNAIEKILESAIVACSYKTFGCKAEFAYLTTNSHEENCGFAPYVCPFYKDCNFISSFADLYLHLKRRHESSVATLDSSLYCNFTVSKEDECVVFLGEQGKNKVISSLNYRRMEIRYVQGSEARREYVFSVIIKHELGSDHYVPVTRPWRRKVEDFIYSKEEALNDELILHDNLFDKDGRLKLRIVLFWGLMGMCFD